MVDLKPGLIGTDARFFLDDGKGGWDPLQLPAAQPVVMGVDFARSSDRTAAVSLPDRDGMPDWEWSMLYGDGSGHPLGLFANNLAPGDRATLLHLGQMTRQRRRAEARAAAKRNRRK